MAHAVLDMGIVLAAAMVLAAIGWSAWCIWQDLRASRQGAPVSRATLQAIALRESRQGWTDGPTWRLRGGQR